MSGKTGSVSIFSLGAAGAQTGAARAAAAQAAAQATATTSAGGQLVVAKQQRGKGAKQEAVTPPATQKTSLLFQRLDWDLQSNALGFLAYPDFVRCQAVCRAWSIEISKDPLVWRAVHTPLHRAAFGAEPAEITSMAILRARTERLFRPQVHLGRSVYTTRSIAFPGLNKNFFQENVRERKLTPQHNHLLVLNDGSIQVWKFSAGKFERIAAFQAYTDEEVANNEILQAYFAPDGTLITMSIANVYKTWTAQENETNWQLKTAYPATAHRNTCFSSNGMLMVLNPQSRVVTVLKCTDNAWHEDSTFDMGAHIRKLSFTPEGDVLTTHFSQQHNEAESTQIWRQGAAGWERVKAIPSYATCHRYTSDLKLLIGKLSGEVEIWNRTTWQLEATIPANDHAITGVRYSPTRIIAMTISHMVGDVRKEAAITVWNKVADKWVLQTYINEDMLPFVGQSLQSAVGQSLQSAYTLPDGNILVTGSLGANALCDFGASPMAALSEISDRAMNSGSLRRFFSLPASIKTEIYRKLFEAKPYEAKFSRVLGDPNQFATAVQDAPRKNLMLPAAPRLTGLFQGGYQAPFDHLQDVLKPVVKNYLATLVHSPEQIAYELAIADIEDRNSRDYYIMKYLALSPEKKEVVRKMLADLNALDKLATIAWSARDIYDAIVRLDDKDTTRTAWLLDKFTLLPVDFKNAVYGALYKMHRPTKEKDVPRYGEFAFFNQNNLRATNNDRAQAIDLAKRDLERLQGPSPETLRARAIVANAMNGMPEIHEIMRAMGMMQALPNEATIEEDDD